MHDAARPVPAAAPWAESMFSFGVTSTNGKTSATHMLAAAVAAAGHSSLRIGTLDVDLDGQVLPRGKDFAAFLDPCSRPPAAVSPRATLARGALTWACSPTSRPIT